MPAELKVGDRVVHVAEHNKVKCRLKAHGTVETLEPYQSLPGALVDWDSENLPRLHPVDNLWKCVCGKGSDR